MPKPNKRLAEFLINLAIDPTAREKFVADPATAMADAQLNATSRQALLAPDVATLKQLLDVSNQVQTAMVKKVRARKKVGSKK